MPFSLDPDGFHSTRVLTLSALRNRVLGPYGLKEVLGF